MLNEEIRRAALEMAFEYQQMVGISSIEEILATAKRLADFMLKEQ